MLLTEVLTIAPPMVLISDCRIHSLFPQEERIAAVEYVTISVYVWLKFTTDRACVAFCVKRELVQALFRSDERHCRAGRSNDQMSLYDGSTYDPGLQVDVRAAPIQAPQVFVCAGNRLLQYLADRATCRVVCVFNRRPASHAQRDC